MYMHFYQWNGLFFKNPAAQLRYEIEKDLYKFLYINLYNARKT